MSPTQPKAPSLTGRSPEAPDQLERLLLANYDRLMAYVEHHLPRAFQSLCGPEDILQETYAEAVRHAGDFQERGPDSFFRWLATIARNKILDFVQAQKTAKRGGGRVPLALAGRASYPGGGGSSFDCLLDQVAAASSTPSRGAVRKEALAALQVALAQLKDDMRQAVTLRYIEGQSVSQVARTMDRTERAVHMLCYRALRMMKVTMGRASGFLSSTA